MTLQRRGRTWLGLAIALTWLIPGGTSVVRGADLARYLSSDFSAALVIHPRRIGKSTLADAVKSWLPKEMASADPVKAAIAALARQKNLPPGMDPAKLAKLIEGKAVIRVMIFVDPMPTADMPAAPGIIVQFADDIDGDGILSAISSEWQPAEANGVKYKTLKDPEPGKPDLAALVPDARTLIAGLNATVVKMLAKEQGPQPLLKQLQHASFDNDILLEFVAEPLWAETAKGGGKPADKILATMGGPGLVKFAKEIKSVSIKLNFSGKTLLHAEVATDTPDRATMYAAAARTAITDVKPKFEEMKKQPPPLLPPPAIAALSKLGDEVFDGLTVTNDGPRLDVDLAMPASLPDALKLATQILAQMGSQMQPPAAKKP